MSVGEKQCISMARAILCKAKVYIMDEATASIDYTTDAAIQRAIRTHPVFKSSTIITVANRIQTISDSDLIVVLNDGRISERGSPAELLARPDSLYGSLVKAGSSEISAAATAQVAKN